MIELLQDALVKHEKAIFSLCAFGNSLMWGFNGVYTKIAMYCMSPFYSLAFRFSIATICFLLIFHKRIAKHIKEFFCLPTLLICFVTVLVFICSHVSLKYTDASIAGFLYSLAVIFSPFMSFFILKSKVNLRHIFLVLFVVVGMYFLCNGNNGFSFGIGELLALMCSVLFALELVLQDKYLGSMDALTLAFVQAVAISVCAWIIALIADGPLDFAAVTNESWLAVIYTGIFGAMLATVFQNLAMAHLSANYVSLMFCVEPILVAIIAYFVLGEVLAPISIMGGAIIIVGVVIASALEK